MRDYFNKKDNRKNVSLLQKKTAVCELLTAGVVGVGRLELPASTSQMSRATHSAIPRYII